VPLHVRGTLQINKLYLLPPFLSFRSLVHQTKQTNCRENKEPSTCNCEIVYLFN